MEVLIISLIQNLLERPCPIDRCEQFEVKVADGRSLACLGKCSGIEIAIQGQKITTSLFLLPLEGCNLVFEARSLCTLGNIIWNFEKLLMQFTLHGKLVKIQGKSTGEVSVVITHRMERILKKKA